MNTSPASVSTLTQSDEAPSWRHPLIKKGRLGSPLVEVTPFVFKGRLYRLENWQHCWDIPDSAVGTASDQDEVRIRDVETDNIVSVPLMGHAFATAFVWESRVYIFASAHTPVWRQIVHVTMISSDDLKHWSAPETVLHAEKGEHIFNLAVCRGPKSFIMLYESDHPAWPPFTMRYCESSDLKSWRLIPGAIYGKEKYTGGPALYFEGGWYYTLYAQDLGGKWETRITRSTDLIHWQDAPLSRPFVTFDETIMDPPLRPRGVHEMNASDAEICEWHGKTIVYFTGSDQQYAGDLQWAEYAGTPRRLLESYFTDEPALQSLDTGTTPEKPPSGSPVAIADRSTPWDEGYTIELPIPASGTIDCVVVEEDLERGQRVRAHSIEALVQNKWQPLSQGGKIGARRVHRFQSITPQAIRLRLQDFIPMPGIQKLAAYTSGSTR